MDAPKRAPKRARTCDEPHNDRTFDSDWVWEWAKGFACEVDTSKPNVLFADNLSGQTAQRPIDGHV